MFKNNITYYGLIFFIKSTIILFLNVCTKQKYIVKHIFKSNRVKMIVYIYPLKNNIQY